jgi:hypothetical protein
VVSFCVKGCIGRVNHPRNYERDFFTLSSIRSDRTDFAAFSRQSLRLLISTSAFAQSVGEKTGVNSTLGISPTTADFVKEAGICPSNSRAGIPRSGDFRRDLCGFS